MAIRNFELRTIGGDPKRSTGRASALFITSMGAMLLVFSMFVSSFASGIDALSSGDAIVYNDIDETDLEDDTIDRAGTVSDGIDKSDITTEGVGIGAVDTEDTVKDGIDDQDLSRDGIDDEDIDDEVDR